MLDYLIPREQEEMLRTSVRDLVFPDTKTRRVEAYRLVWTWFDRLLAHRHGPEEAWLLKHTLDWATEKNVPVGEALGQLINFIVREEEQAGFDFTDPVLDLAFIRHRMEAFHARKNGREQKPPAQSD